jgi:hypothetical protein
MKTSPGKRYTVERRRLCTYTSEDGLLNLVKAAYETGSLAGAIFPVSARLVLCS